MPDSNREMIDRYAKSEAERLSMHEEYGKWEAMLRADIDRIIADEMVKYLEAILRDQQRGPTVA